MMNIYINATFIGCLNNLHLAAQVEEFVVKAGLKVVAHSNLADYSILCTCGFTKEQQKIAVGSVDGYVAKFGYDRVIVVGCLPDILPEIRLKYKCVGIGEIENLVKELPLDTTIKASVQIANRIQNDGKYYIKICSGCDHNCKYCVVKKAKGSTVSVAMDSIYRQFLTGIDEGATKFVLLADDCGSYGSDIGKTLNDLLDGMLALTDKEFKMELYYVHPSKLLELYPKMSVPLLKAISYMNVPLQSTSQRILKLMGRNYDVAEVLEIVGKIRGINPEMVVYTHLIYGFPTETQEEFGEMFGLAGRFSSVEWFQYSECREMDLPLLPPEEIAFRERDIMRFKRRKIC